jgi:DNA-binding NarL/FixJ family response regulator
MPMQSIKMLVVSADTMMCSEIAEFASRSYSPIEIIGTFPDFPTAAQHLAQYPIDVILIDASQPHQMKLLRQMKMLPLHRIPTPVVILRQPTISMVLQLLSVGVRSILDKSDNLEYHLTQAIFDQQVALYLSPGILRFIDGQQFAPTSLRPREYDVLKLLATGLEPKAIGPYIDLGRSSVYRVINSLRARFNARNNAHLIAIAHQKKLLDEKPADE